MRSENTLIIRQQLLTNRKLRGVEKRKPKCRALQKQKNIQTWLNLIILTLAPLASISLARCSPNMICAAFEFPYACTTINYWSPICTDKKWLTWRPVLAHKNASIEDQRHPARTQVGGHRRRHSPEQQWNHFIIIEGRIWECYQSCRLATLSRFDEER